MAKVRLTMNQREALQSCATDQIQGRALGSVRSLVKRGLIVEVFRNIQVPLAVPHGIRASGKFRTERVKAHRLTPAGLELYTEMRTKQYEAEVSRLEKQFLRSLQAAQARTEGLPPEPKTDTEGPTEGGTEEYRGHTIHWMPRPKAGAQWKGTWMVWANLEKTHKETGSNFEYLVNRLKKRIDEFHGEQAA